MNRTTVVFLALAILLAHTLAIHQTPDGGFAPPYERAHVAFRVGRNLAFEERATWDVQSPSAEPYPSPLWVGLAALAAELDVYPTTLAQVLGILFALCSLVVVAQFSANRLAGLIAPVLIATSGSACACAASGTEAPLALLLVAASFLAFERRWSKTFAVALSALVLTRPEGAVLVLGFVLLELLDRPRDTEGAPHRALFGSLTVVVLACLALAGLRRWLTGSFLSPFGAELTRWDPARSELGLSYVWSFFSASGSGTLVLLPLGRLAVGRLPAMGRRATLLFLAWAGVTVLSGGDRLPFWNALAPGLPLLFLGIQDALASWLDRRPRLAPFAWTLLGITTAASLFVSKVPGDIGPLPFERWLRSWMQPPATLARAFEHPLGRLGLLAEIREVERLRTAGVFLRDQVSADATIGTFWPGTIGYLSRKQVLDLLGRAQPLDKGTRTHTWRGAPKVDLLEALSHDTDYLVLESGVAGPASSLDLLHGWLQRYDLVGDTPERARDLLETLRRYELVSVPVAETSGRPDVPSPDPFLILRHKRLGLSPVLELSVAHSTFEVGVRHRGHDQVVDLELRLEDEQGGSLDMRPTGEWVRAAEIDARTDLLLYDTGPNSILLVRGSLPPDAGRSKLVARLHTPGISADSSLATAATASALVGP